LTDAWKYKLAQTSKEILLEMGKAKQKKTLGGFKHKEPSVLSIVDKLRTSQHTTLKKS
jgi:hypothetical protein